MSISLTEDIRSMAEFKAEPMSLARQAKRTGRPVIVTSKGKADVVIMDAAQFEKRMKLVNLAQLLAEGEADLRAGRKRPAAEFFAEWERE